MCGKFSLAGMMIGIGLNQGEFDLAELRARLRQMTDAELRRFGRNAIHIVQACEVFEIQLAEARAEFKRRNQLRGSKNK